MEIDECSQAIRLVDNRTAALISSGEVISSLGLAVKELIENSLDANATIISLDLHNYGIDTIEVSDNGSGIRECDFECIARRHCTSKINKFEDLSDLTSFGFRGEALSSLCSLSEMTIVTRHTTSSMGSKLVFTSEGQMSMKCAVARQVGTTVTISQLFSNYPVRRKHLIENSTKEYQKLIQLITPYCVGFTGIQIQCRNHTRNKRIDFLSVNKNNSLRGNILQLFEHDQVGSIQEFVKCDVNQEILDEFKVSEKIQERQSVIQISGFVSKCDMNSSRRSPDRQFYFVNNRPVEFKRLKKLVNDVYSDFCKGFPFVVLKIDAPRNTIDVNISPDKRSLRVEDEDLILAIVKSSLCNMYNNKSTAYTSNSHCTAFRSASEILKASRDEEECSVWSNTISRKRCTSPLDPEFNTDSLQTHAQTQHEFEIPSSPTLPCSPRNQTEELITEISEDFPLQSKNVSVYKRMKTHQGESLPQPTKQLYITDIFPSCASSFQAEVSRRDNSHLMDCCGDFENFQVDDNDIELLNQSESIPEDKQDDENDCSVIEEPVKTIFRRELKVSVNMLEIKKNFPQNYCLKPLQTSSDDRRFKVQLSVTEDSEAENELKTELHKEAFRDMEIIGQFNKGFVIAKFKNDLFIIDQHASDEKYNYEHLCATTILESQPLIHPVDLELGAFQESVLSNNVESFAKSGFKFKFDQTARPGKRAKLTAVPMSKDSIFGKQDIEEMLHEITQSGTISANYRPSRVKQMLASRACRKSIMIGDTLSTSQMKKLLVNMSSLRYPWTCAHGRPSVRHLLNQDCALLDLS